MQIYRHGTRPARTRRSEDPGKGGPQLKIAVENGKLYVYPEGRISAENADAFERELSDAISAHAEAELVIDAAGLEYISSSGLRVLLRRQQQSDEKITILNASPEVYEIFSVTGFTKIMNVEKALRFVSIEGLEQIDELCELIRSEF